MKHVIAGSQSTSSAGVPSSPIDDAQERTIVETVFNDTEAQRINRVAQADRDEGKRKDGLTSAERDELRQLRKENRQLKLEREILSKPRFGSLRKPHQIR